MKKIDITQVKRIIFLILSIAVAIIIFKFSSQDGEKSGSTSRGFVREIVDVLPSTRKLDEEKKDKIVEDSQPFVRKLAHFSIYTLLGICLFNFFNTYGWSTKRTIILTIITGAIYAASDEIHQLFSDGRTPLITDVFIDTFGALCGSGIVVGIGKILNKKN